MTMTVSFRIPYRNPFFPNKIEYINSSCSLYGRPRPAHKSVIYVKPKYDSRLFEAEVIEVSDAGRKRTEDTFKWSYVESA